MNENELDTLFEKFKVLITYIGFSKVKINRINLTYTFKYKDYQIIVESIFNMKKDGLIYVTSIVDYEITLYFNHKKIYSCELNKYDNVERELKKVFPHPFRKSKIDKLLHN